MATGQQLYRQSVGRNVELTFSFDKPHPIQNVGTLATGLAALARRVENWDNGEISRDVFEDIPELDFAYLYSRHLQHSDEPDPKFPNGQPDPSEGFAAYAEYRNRREARARQEGIYKPLLSPARWKVAQLHKFGLMSTKRLTEIVQEKEVKARQYAKCDAYWLLIVVDFIDSAQEQEIRVDDLSIESDVFEKIIVYKPYFDQIVDVRVQPRRAASGA